MTWSTLQGLATANLPSGIGGVTSESVALLPDMGAKIGLFANVTTTNLSTAVNLVVANETWTLGVSPNTPMLLEVVDPNLVISPASAVMTPRVREAEMCVFADGTAQLSNVIRGIARAGVLADFTGDVFSKLAQQPDVTGKDKVTGQSQAQYVARLLKGELYHREKIRITSSAWNTSFDDSAVYVILRKEHQNLITVTPPTIFTSGVTYLYLPDGQNDFAIPAYTKPYVDTGDPLIRCFHIYANLTTANLRFEAFPNYLSDEYCELKEPAVDRLTWVCSVMANMSGTGSGYTLFGQGWQPTIQTWCTYAARVVCFSGLNGNTIAMSATGTCDIPPAMRGTLYAGLPYPKIENPAEVVERINLTNSTEKKGERRIETNQFVPLETDCEPPKKMCRRN
jgi:hypothetical protein